MISRIDTGSGGTIEYSDARQLQALPIVSVLLLAYNHREHLPQAIESVIAQEFCSVELLIGEDCSTDGSREVAIHYQRLYPHLVRVITAQNNVGAYQNYMRLLDAARGEFIAQLDGDDYWLPGKLSRQVTFLRERQGAAAVYSNALVLNNDDVTIGRFNNVEGEEFDLAALLRRGNFLNTSSLLFRASMAPLLRDIGHEFIDYELHLTLARRGNLVHISQPLVAYRFQSAGSMVANENDRVRELYWQAILSVSRNLVSDIDLAAGMADFLRKVAFHAMRTGSTSLLRKWMPRVMAAAPVSRMRFFMLLVVSISRGAARETWGRTYDAIRGGGHAVLYRR